ncbi:MAG: exopolysaccharide biosynthesis polyprenyl glycosylphosphotransferase [Actinobacteria bacterium]|nr:exopolysaccharide biosynthesis polyprenyl glycosylphosphotransferase [Actinomycetota bacterium]
MDHVPDLPLLGRLNAHGFRLLMAADAVVIIGALVLPMAVYVLTGQLRNPWPLSYYVVGYLIALVLHFVSFYFSGLYEREQRLGSRPVLPRIVSMAIGAMLLVALVQFATQINVLPRPNLAVVPILVALGLAGNRRISRAMRDRREGPPKVLLVGVPDDVNLAREHLDDVHGFAKIVGTTSNVAGLPALQQRTGATDVLVVTSRMIDDAYPEPLSTLEQLGVNVLRRISAQDTLLGLSGVREVAGLPFVVLGHSALPPSRARFKRTIELLELVVTVPVWLPVMTFIALYVLVTAGRPVLFRQRRVGMDGRPFNMVKFRTMRSDAEADGRPRLASSADHRVVPSLRWLRRTRLDELPNLWNVIRGEMSIVGPRPERPELTEQFEVVIPGYDRRHEIPPGLTGLAQVHGRYHTDPEYKLGYDLQYLVNWSPVLDLQIQLRTIWVMLTRRL